MSTELSLAPGLLRRVFAAHPTGVVAIAALFEQGPIGLAASSFTSVSLDPPIVSFCMAHSSTTWPVLRRSPRLGLSVLAAEQEEAGRQLSARGIDRFAGVRWHSAGDGAVLLDGASAWLECSVEQEIAVGDHDVVLLRVHCAESNETVPPLVFHDSRFRQLH